MSVMVQLSQESSVSLGLSIYYACRSESSNKSLVVLDKDPSCSKTTWRFLAKLDHHWHQLSLIHQAVSIRIQNWKKQHFWPAVILIQKFLCPQKISEARKSDNLEAWQGDCCQRHPTAGGRNIMSSLVLPLPALRLSLACREFSTWATDRDLWQRIQNFRLLIFV